MSDLASEARKSFDRDWRFRAIVQSIVARVLQNHGAVNPERADREAYNIALNVATLTLQTIYEGDAELKALRLEREALRTLAQEALTCSPPRPFIVRADGA